MNEFKVTIRENETAHVLDLWGYLDAHTAPILEDAFQKLLNGNKYRLIVNCKELTYISSAGLGVFMAYIEDVRANNGDIKMSNMSPKVYNIFDLLGFPMLYDIVNDESEAIAKFAAVS
ncbi:MAG TPA: STAS domain-containing protein [Bacteroidota bacterium]|nr:STAS domain-containing protein [Bacteroidota bacterium]